MEKFLQNIFDDFNVEESEVILNEIENMSLPKERADLYSLILEKAEIKGVGKIVGLNKKNKRNIKRTLIKIRNAAACFGGVLLLSSISVYAFSGKSLFDFFLQQDADKSISSYAEYDGDTMHIDDYKIKLSSCLFDEEIGSGYCVLTVEGKDKTGDDLTKFLNSNYIHFSFRSSSAFAEIERTIQDDIVYIPVIFLQDNIKDIKLWVIGDSDYIEEKEASIVDGQVKDIVYHEDGSIAKVNLGSLNLKNSKKLPNKHRTFQTNAKLVISSIGLMVEGLDEGTIFDLSIEYKNGTTEIVIENHKILSETMMLTTMSNYVDDSNVEKGRYVKTQLLYGNVIELDNISKVNINGEQIDLN